MPTKGPYPPNWKAIVAAVRERSGDRCEALDRYGQRCGIPNGAWVHRYAEDSEQWLACPSSEDADEPCDCRDFHLWFHRDRLLVRRRIMLTTAHLCQDSTCGDLDHLQHMCNRHHLLYDVAQHARSAAITRRARRVEAGQGAMTL